MPRCGRTDSATHFELVCLSLTPLVPPGASRGGCPYKSLLPSCPQSDPLWRLPLHAPYRKLMDSKVADISSTGPAEGGGGAILAALFMAEFVKDVPR